MNAISSIDLASSTPERAIKRLREEYPNDQKVARCIQLNRKHRKPCPFQFTALDGRKVDSRDYVGKVVSSNSVRRV